MLKVIGAVLVCVSGAAFGLGLVGELKEKVSFFRALKECLQLVSGEIRFGCSTLPEAFCGLKERTKQPLAMYFYEIGEAWRQEPEVPIGKVWENVVQTHGKDLSLNKEETIWFSSIGSRLGHLDKEMQVNTIAMILEELEQREEQANSNLMEKGKLYPCVGTMSGVLATLLLI